ncbi:hypothetical protein CMI41_04270 [Candidatus Pacearchaeota archaeon]|nr:hypothetical protein [Candidatus Pacearchaeota archaeon]|tara:strand:- start:11938 stop:12495 length:558 start_codon:yes stop_codon:yes gene_type:complete
MREYKWSFKSNKQENRVRMWEANNLDLGINQRNEEGTRGNYYSDVSDLTILSGILRYCLDEGVDLKSYLSKSKSFRRLLKKASIPKDMSMRPVFYSHSAQDFDRGLEFNVGVENKNGSLHLKGIRPNEKGILLPSAQVPRLLHGMVHVRNYIGVIGAFNRYCHLINTFLEDPVNGIPGLKNFGRE